MTIEKKYTISVLFLNCHLSIITNNFGASLKEDPSLLQVLPQVKVFFFLFQARSSLNCRISYQDVTMEKS